MAIRDTVYFVYNRADLFATRSMAEAYSAPDAAPSSDASPVYAPSSDAPSSTAPPSDAASDAPADAATAAPEHTKAPADGQAAAPTTSLDLPLAQAVPITLSDLPLAQAVPIARLDALLDEEAIEAIRSGDQGAFAQLLDRTPALLEAIDGNSCGTAMHWAALVGDLGLVRMLRERGARMDRCATAGMQPLHWACTRGHLPVVEYLVVEAGCAADATDARGTTPLMVAAQYNQSRLVYWLGKHWPQALPMTDGDADSALHWAAYKNSLASLTLLCGFGLSPTVADHHGSTALHLAISRSSGAVVRWLLEHEEAAAMLAATDAKGRTPKQLAVEKGLHMMRGLLTEREERSSDRPPTSRALWGISTRLYATTTYTWHAVLDSAERQLAQWRSPRGEGEWGTGGGTAGAAAQQTSPMSVAMEG